MNADCIALVVEVLDQDDVFFFAMTCNLAYDIVKKLGRPLKTRRQAMATSLNRAKWVVENFKSDLYTTDNFILGICGLAAYLNNKEVLEWGIKNNLLNILDECDEIIYGAVLGNHISILENYKSELKEDLDIQLIACAKAATNGRLKVLIWLHKNGCQMNYMTTSTACFHNHLDILQWAVSQGCQWSPSDCLDGARARGYSDMEKWILDNFRYPTVNGEFVIPDFMNYK